MLERHARSDAYPKWSSLCHLKLQGKPVLDAAALFPGATPITVRRLILDFAGLLGVSQLQVRSDGGRERTAYYRGGDSFGLAQTGRVATRLIRSGRAVILHEPTDRLKNQLTVNLLMDVAGVMVAEVLGPGFDAGDLNRGGVLPHYQLKYQLSSWMCIERIIPDRLSVLRLGSDNDARIRNRLQTVASRILPARGIRLPSAGPATTTRWLRRNGYDMLWSEWELDNPLGHFTRWYEDAYMIARSYRRIRSWAVLSMSGSDLGDGRFVYWDLIDANRKFALPGPATRR